MPALFSQCRFSSNSLLGSPIVLRNKRGGRSSTTTIPSTYFSELRQERELSTPYNGSNTTRGTQNSRALHNGKQNRYTPAKFRTNFLFLPRNHNFDRIDPYQLRNSVTLPELLQSFFILQSIQPISIYSSLLGDFDCSLLPRCPLYHLLVCTPRLIRSVV